jgi:hypothetical protein
MQDTNDLRQRLLAQLPQPEKLSQYREQVTATIEKEQKRLRVERLAVTLFWIFCAASATAYLWFGNSSSQLPRSPFLACIFFLWGGVELLKHHIHAAQVQIQKEIKQLQLQVLALQARDRGDVVPAD